MSVPPEDSGSSRGRLSTETSSHYFEKPDREQGIVDEKHVETDEPSGGRSDSQLHQQVGRQPAVDPPSAPADPPPLANATAEAPSEGASPFRRLIGWRLVVVELW